MPLSREARITILLVIDIVFFFVELITGYAVGSLALVADSFHMLNDVMSLVVALYAIKLTNSSSNDSRYTYGWHRAEILAALVNGVFLLALCFSIFMEAIERFFSEPAVSNPKLVVIVGSLGLGSNIVGLFLFHEHSHSHGPSHKKSPRPSRTPSIAPSVEADDSIPTPIQKRHSIEIRRGRTSPGDAAMNHSSVSESFSSLYGHPAATRASLVQTAQEIASARSPSPTRHRFSIPSTQLNPSTPLASPAPHAHHHAILSPDPSSAPLTDAEHAPLLPHVRPEPPSAPPSRGSHGHGHAHGSMNMRALVLHVLGDALGNVGVILTGLIIWKTTWPYKFYCDPVISLIITVIIFSSALPLVRSASYILLQGVPSTVDIDEVRDSILAVDGVLSVHELHVWQLSENKLVASVHVLASRHHDFMPVAVKIREAMHHLGIHSCTIQPEYHPHNVSVDLRNLQKSEDSSCLILCPADAECDPSEHACCPPPAVIGDQHA